MIAPYLSVAFGGALGAVFRYIVVLSAQNVWGLRFPFGTLIVNTLGSFLAGFFISVLVGRFNAEEYWRLFIFTGFLGGFTTFSSFSAESLFLFEQSQWIKLIVNIMANNIGALSMVLLGNGFARMLLSGNLNPN